MYHIIYAQVQNEFFFISFLYSWIDILGLKFELTFQTKGLKFEKPPSSMAKLPRLGGIHTVGSW